MIYGLKENIRLVELENEAYIEEDGGKYRHNIGGAAVEFIKQIDGKKDMEQILAELIKIYGPNVEPYTLAKDLENFIGVLLENGIIEVVSCNLGFNNPEYNN